MDEIDEMALLETLQSTAGAHEANAKEEDEKVNAVWNSISWVNNVSDSAMKVKELQEAFNQIMFELPIPSEEDDQEDRKNKKRLRTAAEDAEEKQKREEMRKELEELAGGAKDEEGGEDEEDDILDWDKISENEELEKQQELDEGLNEEFQMWLEEGQLPYHESYKVNERRLAHELQEMYMGDFDAAVAVDPLPERLKEFSWKEQRPRLEPRPLPDGTVWEFDRSQEALWILRQLTTRGNLLSHSSETGKLMDMSVERALDTPLVIATIDALKLMFDEHLEPAHIAIHYQDQLAPLLHALWLNQQEITSSPNPSVAYSSSTGERQEPILEVNYVGFKALSAPTRTPVYDRDQTARYGSPNIRKPCAIELGRLLVAILQLDALCHNIQRGQLMLRRKLEELVNIEEKSAQHKSDLEIFDMFDFDLPVHIITWQQYINYISKGLDSSSSTNATVETHTDKIAKFGLQDAFAQYVISPQMYQYNLVHMFKFHSNPAPESEDIYSWAYQQAQSATYPIGGDEMLQMFNLAVADELSLLPAVTKKVFDLFCSDGLCVIAPTSRSNHTEKRALKISRLLDVNPRQYLECVEEERGGLSKIELTVSVALVREELALESFLILDAEENLQSSWAIERSKAVDMLIPRIIKKVAKFVEQALLAAGENCTLRMCSQHLGNLCSLGPYQQTFINIQGFQEDASTWDSGWNCVEALPTSDFESVRICGAVRGENGVTTFACIDENGTLRGTCRWVDCDLRSPEGQEIDYAQKQELLGVFRKCVPSLIAVAATNANANSLIQQLRRFIDNELQDTLFHKINVIWAPSSIATTYSWSQASVNEMPNADVFLRCALSIARFTRDPLMELCRLFDPVSRDVLRLPLGIHENTNKDKVYEALCWEMSLWVTACGIDLNSIMVLPNPSTILQFVAGLGPRKASAFVKALDKKGKVGKRDELDEVLGGATGDDVCKNAVASIRIFTSDSSSELVHPLDCTLIRPQDYASALLICQGLLGTATPGLALAKLVLLDEKERRRLCMRSYTSSEFHRFLVANKPKLPGRRKTDFLVDEMAALGKSFMRRPFRIISAEYLMKLLTGVHYLRSGEPSPVDSSLVVRDGETVQGIVQGINLNNKSIRVLEPVAGNSKQRVVWHCREVDKHICLLILPLVELRGEVLLLFAVLQCQFLEFLILVFHNVAQLSWDLELQGLLQLGGVFGFDRHDFILFRLRIGSGGGDGGAVDAFVNQNVAVFAAHTGLLVVLVVYTAHAAVIVTHPLLLALDSVVQDVVAALGTAANVVDHRNQLVRYTIILLATANVLLHV